MIQSGQIISNIILGLEMQDYVVLIAAILFLIWVALWRIGDWLRRGVKEHAEAMNAIRDELSKRHSDAP
jgi:hypothetical protein